MNTVATFGALSSRHTTAGIALATVHRITYAVRDFLNLTQASRVEQDLKGLTARELEDIGLAPYQVADLVASMRQQRV